MKQLAAHPIVTYVFGFTGPSSLLEIFAKEGLVPNVVLTARDADVIKTYVRLGLGIGIVASMAIDPREDGDLVDIDTSHLFPAHVTWIGFRRGGLLQEIPDRLHAALCAAPDAAGDRARRGRGNAGGCRRTPGRARIAGPLKGRSYAGEAGITPLLPRRKQET